jgi:gluconokinase
MQICADVLGRRVTASAEPEATARGTALLALEALGVLRSLADAPARFDHTYEPNQAHHERYLEAIRRQRSLYEIAIPWQATGSR